MKGNKRLVCTLLCGCLLAMSLFAVPTKALAAIPAFEEATIIGDGVNMRLRPTVDSPFVLKLDNGTRVGVFCEEVDGWYRIIYGNYRGYVSKDYVFLPSTDMLVGNVIGDETPVYRSPGDFSEVMDTLNAGAGVSIVMIQGDYYGIEYVSGELSEQLAAHIADPCETADAHPVASPSQEASALPAEGTGEPEPAPASSPESETPPSPEATVVAGTEASPATPMQEEAVTGYIKKETVNLSTSKNPMSMLKEGMTGVEVLKMQRELKERGFMGASATGEFGAKTKAAVTLFQEVAGLSADGIAGAQTLELLYGDNDITCTYARRLGIANEVQLIPWEEAQDIFYKECTARVTDVETGISWNEKRFGGWFHADSEPVTADDVAKMKEAYGGEWSWDRRAVWVTVGDITMAASINGMPHMSWTIDDNNFDGHHCIHFYQSKVHENSAECPRHQAMVQYAYSMGQE